jgi:hypothetical protein
MAATDPQHRFLRRSNEIGEGRKNFRVVVIKIAQRTAQHNGVRLKPGNGFGERADVCDFGLRFFHQARDVGDDVLQRQRGDLSFLFELGADIFAKLSQGDLRKVGFVAQKIVYDQNAR